MQHAEWVEEVCQTETETEFNHGDQFSLKSGRSVSAKTNVEVYPYKAEFKNNFWNNHPELEAKLLTHSINVYNLSSIWPHMQYWGMSSSEDENLSHIDQKHAKMGMPGTVAGSTLASKWRVAAIILCHHFKSWKAAEASSPIWCSLWE